jgi:hypothetical protein
MTETITKENIYPQVISKVNEFITPERIAEMRRAWKCLKKIGVCIEDKDIELSDIMCADIEEYMLLKKYREKMRTLRKQLSEQSLKKLFR